MKIVKLVYADNSYSYKDASDTKLCILGLFLNSDIGLNPSSFKEWSLDDKQTACGGNVTDLEKENGKIYLRNRYLEDDEAIEPTPILLEMTISQFVHILDDWEEKVCKKKPKEVVIKHEEGKFWIETSE